MPAARTLTGLRYLGLAGSIALAAGAYRVGALPGTADGDGLPAAGQLPGLAAALAGLVALTVAWWGLGLRAPSGRWMLVTAGLWALPIAVAPPIASRDLYAYACQGAAYAGDPCAWTGSVPAIWRGAPTPYGPLATVLAAGATEASGGRIAVAVALLRLVALAGVVLATAYGLRLATRFGVSAGNAAWLGLASPLVLIHAVGGAHNDALLTGLVLASLAYAADRRGLAAGLALGLAVAVKVTALAVLPFVVLALARDGRETLGRAAAAATGAAALAYAALAVASGLGLDFARGLWRTGELAQWTSLPTAVGMSAGYLLRLAGFGGGFDVAVAVARGFGIAAIVAVAAGACWWAWQAGPDRGHRAVVGAGVTFAAVALFGPVFYPWYALTPLALLAASIVETRARAWLGVGAGVLPFLVLPNGVGLAPRTKAEGAIAVTVGLTAAAVVGARRAARAGPRWRGWPGRARTRTRDPRPER